MRQTFFRRQAAQACWVCLRFKGSPSPSDSTNLSVRLLGEDAGAVGLDIMF